ncbi:Gfo/Idh/MocA family oxidoreductase [candidate division KSB1 bacterium]|nr:Gfo/Idh/MocA family oxidoreductase [candidate division KSB1 bacterium]
MKKIRWGILSTANIGIQKVIPAMQKGEHCEVIAIASRSIEKARQVADKLTIPKAYGSYKELLADTQIDAIYNPLPNHLHVPWSIKALEAGKHVLCEKPISLSVEEGQQLINFAKTKSNLKLMEAFMYCFHPQWQKAKQFVNDGKIGELRTIQSVFSYFNDDPNNVRNKKNIGGGGLMDIGCYCISLSRFIINSEPKRVCGIVEYDPNFGTDRLASGMMDFGKTTSTFTCSTQLSGYQRVNIFGTKGRIEIEIPFNAPHDKPTKMWLQNENQIDEIIFDICDQYTIQGDLFSLAIIKNTEVPTPIKDAVANMKVLEKIVESANKNCWLSL